jgi:hypothetical protein
VRALPSEPLSVLGKLRVTLEVVATYPRARLALRGGDLRHALAKVRDAPLAEAAPAEGPALQGALRLGRAVYRTARFVPGDSRCLVRSLVLSRLLALRGVESRLVIGVRPGSDFAAHAWVEREGLALLPAGEAEFTRLTEL